MKTTGTYRWRTLALVLAAFALVVTACGDDDTTASAGTTATTTTQSTSDTSDGATGSTTEPVVITGVDYVFEGVPDTAKVGTKLAFHNGADDEVHEMVLLKVADGETRPLHELLALPEAERDAVTTFVGVTVAFPGEDAAFTQGSLTLTEPGRYVILCSIPTGADPQAYRDAIADPDAQGPPDVPGGPPHLVHGMVGEIEVTS